MPPDFFQVTIEKCTKLLHKSSLFLSIKKWVLHFALGIKLTDKGVILLPNHIDLEILNSLSQSELSVLNYVYSHKDEVIYMSIQQLSEQVFLSTATILRLCKKLNLNGFSELKYTLKTQIAHENKNSSSMQTLDKIIQNYYQTIENTGRLIDLKSMDMVVNFLLSDKTIHLYSNGLSSISMTYMERFLLSVGRKSKYYSTAPLAYRMASKMNSNDVILIASTSGATPPVINIAQIAKNSGAVIISITNMNNTPLSKLSDIAFYTPIKDRDYYGTDIKSRCSTFFIIHMIIECYLYRLNPPELHLSE